MKVATFLRIGLLIDDWTVPQWVYRIVADIQSSEIARISVVIKNADPPAPPRSLWRKVLSYRKELLYLLVKKLDELKNRAEPNAFEPMNLKPLLDDCPVVSVLPRKEKYDDYFEEGDLARILEYDLDVALRFGFNILKGGVLQIARHGIWSYHHGDNRTHRGGPAGFWEVMEGEPTTGSILQVLSPRLDDGKILYRSYAATDPFSVTKNRNNYYWKSSAFVMRKLEDLAEEGPEGLDHETTAADRPPSGRPIYKIPTNRRMLELLGGWIKRYAGCQIKKIFFQEQWFLAFGLKGHFTPLLPPRDRFWADPFPIKKEDKYFVFIEEYLEKTKKGHISVIEIDPNGRWSRPVKVLEKDYHLAYPFVFEWQGEYYMLPETSSQKTLELYRCRSFPHQWQLEKVLMEGVNAVDATLAEMEGSWWLFVNMAAVAGNVKNWDELYLFYADHPLGPWKPHRRNPVKSDVRNSRPAGRVFSENGRFFRPAQDCSKRYGYAISINQILRISPTDYEEKEVSKILPQWRKDLMGNHTFNRMEGLTVLDGLIRRPRW